MVVTHPTSSLSINDNWSPACSGFEGCVSLSYLCNVFSVVGVVFDGMEKRQRLMDHDISFSGFWNIQEVFTWLNIIFVNENSSKYSWSGYILPSQTECLLNSSCDPNLTSNLTSKKCNFKPYPYTSFPTSSLNGSCNRSLRFAGWLLSLSLYKSILFVLCVGVMYVQWSVDKRRHLGIGI